MDIAFILIRFAALSFYHVRKEINLHYSAKIMRFLLDGALWEILHSSSKDDRHADVDAGDFTFLRDAETAVMGKLAGVLNLSEKADWSLIDEQTSASVRSTVEPDDETLLMRLQAGNMDALRIVFQRYSRLIFTIASRVLQDKHEAEDLVQDLFLFILNKSKSFDPAKGSAHSWLMQVTYHRAYDRRRYLRVRSFYDRAQSNQTADALPSIVDSRSASPEDFFAWQSYLRPAWEGLSDDQRKTLGLFFYEGYTLREISGVLGQSFGNVQHHFYRGINRLREFVFEKSGENVNRDDTG